MFGSLMKKPSLLFYLILVSGTQLYASFSVRPADAGFPGENKPFTFRAQPLNLPSSAEGNKKRIYDITVIFPKESNDKPISRVDLLSAGDHPKDFQAILKITEVDKTHSSVNLRLGETVASNFIIRVRYADFPISSTEIGHDIYIKEQIEKFKKIELGR